jgi:chemotaxis protein CheD
MSDDVRRDVAVRIGDLQALAPGSGRALVAIGLGSCAGVVMIDQGTGACALAHVFLPRRPDAGARDGVGPGTYADEAIPELVRRVGVAGGRPHDEDPSLVAIIAGGARMFAARPGSDVGGRNLVAVRAALELARVPIVAEDGGGRSGRTLRVEAGPRSVVTVRVVGSEPRQLWASDDEASSGRRAA